MHLTLISTTCLTETRSMLGIRSTNGVYPVWKCISTISGVHTQAIYDVKW